MIVPDDLDLQIEFKEVLRIGVLLSYYEKQGEYIEQIEDVFPYRYIAMYFSFPKSNRYGYTNNLEIQGGEETAYLPMAIYTSRLNPRIRFQSGMFLAYNLYAEPSNKAFDEYEYIQLEKIQQYYLEKCERSDKKPFLYKIVLLKDGIKNIAQSLLKMGLSRERIYPELSSIGERVKPI